MGRGWGTQAGPGPGTLFAGEERGEGLGGAAGTQGGVRAPALPLGRPRAGRTLLWVSPPAPCGGAGGGTGGPCSIPALRPDNPGAAPKPWGQNPKGKRSHGPSLAPSREERFLPSRGVKVLMTKGGAAQERAISSPADPASRAGERGGGSDRPRLRQPARTFPKPLGSCRRAPAAGSRAGRGEAAAGPRGAPDPGHLLAHTVTPRAGDSLPAMN